MAKRSAKRRWRLPVQPVGPANRNYSGCGGPRRSATSRMRARGKERPDAVRRHRGMRCANPRLGSERRDYYDVGGPRPGAGQARAPKALTIGALGALHGRGSIRGPGPSPRQREFWAGLWSLCVQDPAHNARRQLTLPSVTATHAGTTAGEPRCAPPTSASPAKQARVAKKDLTPFRGLRAVLSSSAGGEPTWFGYRGKDEE